MDGGQDGAAGRGRAELAAAFAACRVAVVFLPMVRLFDQTTVGLEALLRWRHPGLGQLAASRILELARGSPLMDRLAPTALAAGLRMAERFGGELQVSINLDQEEIASPALLASLDHALSASSLPPGRLAVELRAATLRAAPRPVARLASALRERGVGVMLDHLRQADLPAALPLRLACVKIDPRLVGRVGLDPAAEDEIRAIVAQAGEAGLRVCAERVETESQAAFLMTAGCRFAQGWLFGPPRPDPHACPAAAAGAWIPRR